jgi:sortase B
MNNELNNNLNNLNNDLNNNLNNNLNTDLSTDPNKNEPEISTADIVTKKEDSSGPAPRDRAKEFREMMTQAQKRRRRNLTLNILLIIFALVFLVSGFFLVKYYYESHKNKEFVSSLKDLLDTEEEYEDPGSDPDITPSTGSGQKTGNTSGKKSDGPAYVTVNDRLVLKRYAKLYEKNTDFMGWLTIEGTSVDYPVMYTPNNEEKYLRKNFDGDYALAGTLFIAQNSDPVRPTTNILIYGHNMKDGSMFSDLLKYTDSDYYTEHKYVRFDTIYRTGRYEVIAAFHGQVLSEGEEGFRYYSFYDAETEEEFDAYVREVKALSSVQDAATAKFGDELLTLSTCDNTGAKEGKRFVIVAKRVGD